MASVPGFREPAEAALLAALTANVTGAVVIRTPYGERVLADTELPTPGVPRVELVMGPGRGVRDEKSSQVHSRDIEDAVRFFICDESNSTRAATYLTVERQVLNAIEQAARENPYGSSGYRFEWDSHDFIRDERDVPPYVGGRVPVHIKGRE